MECHSHHPRETTVKEKEEEKAGGEGTRNEARTEFGTVTVCSWRREDHPSCVQSG